MIEINHYLVIEMAKHVIKYNFFTFFTIDLLSYPPFNIIHYFNMYLKHENVLYQ